MHASTLLIAAPTSSVLSNMPDKTLVPCNCSSSTTIVKSSQITVTHGRNLECISACQRQFSETPGETWQQTWIGANSRTHSALAQGMTCGSDCCQACNLHKCRNLDSRCKSCKMRLQGIILPPDEAFLHGIAGARDTCIRPTVRKRLNLTSTYKPLQMISRK